ncbi:uncharacterized protein LOC113947366 [Corapipo altera]|uniref:uncharacterized protein LOC113947366 n=1 Tax=Corapipo altera TaxID=415028 RepID=UPI000FD62C19|nr:uncharacterized protein LOC113947366 [Corapipo altera]
MAPESQGPWPRKRTRNTIFTKSCPLGCGKRTSKVQYPWRFGKIIAKAKCPKMCQKTMVEKSCFNRKMQRAQSQQERPSATCRVRLLPWVVLPTPGMTQPHPRVEHCPNQGRSGSAWKATPRPGIHAPSRHKDAPCPGGHLGLYAGHSLAPAAHGSRSSSAQLPVPVRSLEMTALSLSSVPLREQHRETWKTWMQGQCLRHPAVPKASRCQTTLDHGLLRPAYDFPSDNVVNPELCSSV